MVRTSALRNLRMRSRNANKAVLLDAVPERRTKRCSPRFRPGGRFCELSFRYLLPGSEGEKCRPLDHMWQTPFIHSVRVILRSNFYIYETFFYLLNPCGKFKGVMAATYSTNAHAPLNTQSHNCLVLLCWRHCLHFCSLAYDLPNRSSGRLYELNAKVERAD